MKEEEIIMAGLAKKAEKLKDNDATEAIDVNDLAWLDKAIAEEINRRASKGDNLSRLMELPLSFLDICEMVEEILRGRVKVIGTGSKRVYYIWDGTAHHGRPGTYEEEKLVTQIIKSIKKYLKSELTVFKKATWEEDYKALVGNTLEIGFSVVAGIANTKRGPFTSTLRSVLQTPADAFVSNRYMVFGNKVLDTYASAEQEKPVLLDHDPSRAVTERNVISVPYVDFSEDFDPNDLSSIGAPNLEKYLSGTFQTREDGVNLFRAIAVGLFADTTSLRCIVDGYGYGNDGKSMFNRIVKQLAPGHTEEAGAEFFGKNARPFAMANIKGQRLIFNAEAENVGVNQDLAKKFSGGDNFNVDQKYAVERVKFPAEGILIFLSNIDAGQTVSQIFDVSKKAMWDRHFPIFFDKSYSQDGFAQDGSASGMIADKKIESRIRENEMEQLAYFMVYLWLEWEKAGYEDYIPLTENQKKLRLKLRGEGDRMDQFIAEATQAGAIHWANDNTPDSQHMTWKSFRESYQAWFKNLETGEEIPAKKVKAEVEARGWLHREENSSRIWMKPFTQNDTWKKAIFEAGEIENPYGL